MWKRHYKDRNKELTFAELLVTIGIIGLIASLGLVALAEAAIRRR